MEQQSYAYERDYNLHLLVIWISKSVHDNRDIFAYEPLRVKIVPPAKAGRTRLLN